MYYLNKKKTIHKSNEKSRVEIAFDLQEFNCFYQRM